MNDEIMTLSQIRALLWIYYSPRPLPSENDDIDLHQVLLNLEASQLIYIDHNESPRRYKVTERGAVYVEAIRNVPLPIQKWVMSE